jgi:hypothetical protein
MRPEQLASTELAQGPVGEPYVHDSCRLAVVLIKGVSERELRQR